MAEQELWDRLVGKRFFDMESDEAFTIIGVSSHSGLALLQYDDGVAWDEMALPNLLTEAEAERIGVSEGGIDDKKYHPLGCGPRLDLACHREEHDWFPTPSDLGLEEGEAPPDKFNLKALYPQLVRCRKCGLSGNVLIEYLGHFPPNIGPVEEI